MKIAYTIFSISYMLDFDLVRTSEANQIGYYCAFPSTSFSWTRATLTELCEAGIQSKNEAFRSRLNSVVNSIRQALNDSKVALCSYTKMKSFAPCKVLRKGRLCSTEHEINLLRDAIWPIRFQMSLTIQGVLMSIISFILLGLASMPLCETKYPRFFPIEPQRCNFLG